MAASDGEVRERVGRGSQKLTNALKSFRGLLGSLAWGSAGCLFPIALIVLGLGLCCVLNLAVDWVLWTFGWWTLVLLIPLWPILERRSMMVSWIWSERRWWVQWLTRMISGEGVGVAEKMRGVVAAVVVLLWAVALGIAMLAAAVVIVAAARLIFPPMWIRGE